MNNRQSKLLDAYISDLIDARTTLYNYVKQTVLSQPGYVDGKHIKEICDTIQDFLESDKRGLLISTPPRHMKSTICSECLPAWYISNDLQREVIIASYNQSQARKMSRSCRLRFDTEEHRRIWTDVEFTVDAVDELQVQGKLNGRPNLIAAGVGAGLTGSGADLIIVDDPVKDAESSESLVMRDKVYDWFTSVAMTRLSPKGKVLIIMTRWHHDDLAGRVINDNPDWEVKNMPAINDMGEALWPERFPIDVLLERKATVGSRVFEALYQGRPTPLEGNLFKRAWFKVTDKPFPAEARRVRYWDRAATANGGDYTAGVLIATMDGAYCVEDVVHIQVGPADVESTIRATAINDGPNVSIRMETEPGSSGVTVVDHYARHILQGFDFVGNRPTGPKETRAMPLAAAFENGLVTLVKAQWNRDYIEEFAEFPVGCHDDLVDASSGAFNELNRTGTEELYFF